MVTRWLCAALLLTGVSNALEPLEADRAALARVAGRRLATPTYTLAELVSWQRRSYAEAVVTSGFLDPRGVSRYRSQPGLHLGYDVAMPAGTPALAAWAGFVVSVVPWADGEWGVTVAHPDGSRATYGHLVPQVAAGQAVGPGTPLGTVAVDHVDVKMRDARGEPLDFGTGSPGPSRERLLTDWWLARLAQRDAENARRAARQRQTVLARRAAHRAQAQELGLWTPRQTKELEQELRLAARAARVEPPAERSEENARRAGLSWEDVRALARRWGEQHPELKRRPRAPEPVPTHRRPLGSWR